MEKVCIGWFFSYYLFGKTGLNSSRTFRVLFHYQISSVWSIIKPWIVLQTKNAWKSLNFIIKMRAFWKMLRIVSAMWDDIHLFFGQNARAWLAWHMVSTKRYHMPHSVRNNGFIERRVRWIFYFTFGTCQLFA